MPLPLPTPVSKKRNKIEYANQYYTSVWSVYASQAFSVIGSYSCILIYVCFENVLEKWHKLCICFVSAFRCAYCYFLNPARKTRPQAPRLPEVTGELKMSSEASLPSPAADVDADQSVLGDNHAQAHTRHIPLKCNGHAWNLMLPILVHLEIKC